MANPFNPLNYTPPEDSSPSGGPFTPGMFGGGGAPPVPSAISNPTGSMPSAPSGGGNFFSNLFGGIENGIGDAVNFIKNNAGAAWRQSASTNPVFQAQGAIRGLLGSLVDANGNPTVSNNPLNFAENMGKNALVGWLAPHAGNAAYKNTEDYLNKNANMKVPPAVSQAISAFSPTAGGIINHPATVLNTAMDTATDPLTYTPLGPALGIFGKNAKMATRLLGNNIGKLYDVTKAGAEKLPIGPISTKAAALPNAKTLGLNIRNMTNSLFQPLAGTRNYFKKAVADRINNTTSGAIAVNKQLQNIFQGTTPQMRTEFTHLLESTSPGTPFQDPQMERLRQMVEPLLEQSKQQAIDKGLLTNEMDLADKGVSRYVPHILSNKYTLDGSPLTDTEFMHNLSENPYTGGGGTAQQDPLSEVLSKVENPLKPSIDANKSRLIEGSIQNINQRAATDPAMQAVLARLGMDPNGGKLFEDDMLKILGHHLHQLNVQSNMRDFLNTVLAKAQKIPKALPDLADRIHEETGTPLGQVTPIDQEGAYLLPKAEADYVNQLSKPESAWSKVWRAAVNGPNQLMFLGSPLIHILNNLGTQTLLHDPGIFGEMPQFAKEAFNVIEPGGKMDEALKAGALHGITDLGAKGSVKDKVTALVDSIDKPTNPFMKVLKGYHNLTPNVESMYRAGAFSRMMDRGMDPESAAGYVQRMYGGHPAGQMSNFDKGMSTVLPFWNWTKTALRSSAERMLNNPAPFSALYHGMNDQNQAATGHSIWQNPNPVSMAIGENDAKGNPEYWTPYTPMLEIPKLLKDVVGGGPVHGLANYLFNRSTPLVKFPAQMLTGHQNPFAPVTDQYNVDPYPLLPSSYNQRGMFFGDVGPKLPASLAQLAQDTSNPFGDIVAAQGKGPLAQGLTNPFVSLGGSISAPNPLSAQKEQTWQQGEIARELKAWQKKNTGQ